MTIKADREDALAVLQRVKELYGPSRDKLMALSEYRSAAWRVVEMNTGLIGVALRGRRNGNEDLNNELTITLFNACYNWEPSYGKFTTYAVACLRFAYLRHTPELRQTDQSMRLPSYLQTESGRGRRRLALQEAVRVHLLSYEEAKVHERLPSWNGRVDVLIRRLQDLDMAESVSKTQVRHTRRFRDEDGFFNAEVDEVEMIIDEDAPSAEDGALNGPMLREAMEKGLGTLNDREAAVVRARFGFDAPSMTLEETGKVFGVTRERIRQIEIKALRKMRHPSRSILYRDFHSRG